MLMTIGYLLAGICVSGAEILNGCKEYYYAIVESSTGKILKQEGNVSASERYAPCSTFKIPLALIGYDTNVLKDENSPLIPYDKKYPAPLESWKSEQTPKNWIKNSCVWYSQEIVERMGMEKIKKYLADFKYGNQDMSGGNPHSWLGASLEISPEEQIAFMRKMLNGKLPLQASSFEKTRKILYIETFDNGVNFYGKTGTGNSRNTSVGWFAGWVEKGKKAYIVLMFLKNYKPCGDALPGGPAAKKKCRELILESVCPE